MTVLSKEKVSELTDTFLKNMGKDATPFQFTNEKGESISYFLQRSITPKEKKELEHFLRRLFPSDKSETGLGRCNCCTIRGLLQGLLIDDTGKPILLKNFNEDKENKENKSECPYHDLYSYLMELHKKKDATYTIYIVTDDNTPEKDDGKEPHFHYTPSHTTEKYTAKKFDLLIEKYINQGGMMFQRMDKYMSETMKQDVPFLLNLIDKVNIHAKNVFTNPLKWLNGCLIKLDGRTWERLSLIDKLHICVYAMITGSSQNNVHYGFQTSEQLLDFSKDGKSEDAVIRWMNTTADPATRQVSSISQKLEKQSVKSNVWIGLTWDCVISFGGKMYVVDFDIQVICPNGQKICYSNKKNSDAELNFDANAACNKLEENPSECVSIKQSGKYTVCVHMWGYKEKGSRTPTIQYPPPGVVLHFPFNIIIHNHGHEQIIPGVWNSANNGSVAMKIGTYDINIENPPDATMSETEARKYLHKMPDFVKDIGDSLTSNVVDLSNVPEKNILYIPASPPLHHASGSGSGSVSASPLSILTQMASASLSASASSKKSTSGSLADRCSSVPKTTTELLDIFKRTPNSTMEVNLRDITPSYITEIRGIKEGALRQYKEQIINTYCDGNGMPREPVLGQDPKVSRFDEEWSVPGAYNMNATVRAIIKQNGFLFFVLNDVKLPSVSSEKWSLVGGFYPTSLSVDNHKHKSAFTSMNTLVTPIVDGENPLIGFIPPTNYKLKLNGREINLKHD